MPEHKLISLCLETSDRIVVNVTLLKEASHYKMRTEYLKVYYGSHDYLERHFDQETLKKSNELKEVIISLLEFVDNSIDKQMF